MLESSDLAARIAQAIEDSPHSVGAIASDFGISEPAVYSWMRTGRISKNKLGRLAELTGKPLEYFLLDDYRSAAADGRRSSQISRLSYGTLADAIKLLLSYLEIRGEPRDWVADPALLEIAHLVVLEAGEPVAPDNVLDLTKRLAARIREGTHDERGTD